MSVICQNFVQNAWRKDLCSNCFKSEADHSDCGSKSFTDRINGGRYIPQATSLYQSRGLATNLHWRPLLPDPVPRIQDRISSRDFGSQTLVAERKDGDDTIGILKDTKIAKKDRRSSVGFASDEALVIGYGGRDYDSDDSPWELGSDDGSINMELLDVTDEDRKITKLTKNNTEFNSLNENLVPIETDTTQKCNKQSTKTTYSSNDNSKTTDKEAIAKIENKTENYYFFSKSNESPKTHLPVFNQQKDYLNNCKEMSIIEKDIPAILHNIQNNNNYGDTNKKLDNRNDTNLVNECNLINGKQNGECHYKSTQKYLLITKVQDSGGSDSDYSTSKQTNGESSTDTESFHDAEETLMVPCSSFLHGIVTSKSPDTPRNYMPKPFETSSVSSVDTSTSDDLETPKLPSELNTNIKNFNNKNFSLTSNIVVSKPEGNKSNLERQQLVKKPMKDSATEDAKQGIYVSTRFKNREIESENDNMLSAKVITEKKDNFEKASPSQTNMKIEVEKSVSDHPLRTPQKVSTLNVTTKMDRLATPNKIIERKFDTKENQTIVDVDGLRSVNTNIVAVTTPCKRQDVSNTPQRKNTCNTSVVINQTPCETKKSSKTTVSPQNQVINKHEECKKWVERNEDWNAARRISQPSSEQAENSQQESYTTESNSSSNRSSPNSRSNRESKLAALALELEKVRCDLTSMNIKELPLKRTNETSNNCVKVGHKLDEEKSVPASKNMPSSVDTSAKYPSIRRGRSLITASQSPKSSLPDLLPENSTKVKKGRFSLKKLLKRGKDSDTLIINNPNEYNPKAWKRQNFDRSRLSLEIVHPMDLTSDPPTSTDSTPTEEKRNSISVFSNPSGKGVDKCKTTRARSLSALPQLGSCSVSEISDLRGTGLVKDDNSSLDRPRVSVPRKAGTVAERSKKYKAPRRTPSFSELSSPSSCSSPTEKPPKPPPPPRGKSLPPPQPPPAPPPLDKTIKNNQTPIPARPPPPRAPDTNANNVTLLKVSNRNADSLKGDYANLGDIRLNITPKKPQRPSAISFARDALEMDDGHPRTDSRIIHPSLQNGDNTYESLEAQEEEDHYTYLDDLETQQKAHNNKVSNNKEIIEEDTSSEDKRSSQPPSLPRTSLILKKPWMNLHASYAAIAAANYESLAELITTAISENLEQFQKSASSLRWSDFDLESEDPIQILEDKIVYNAVYKSQSKTKVTLMVTTQKQHTTQNCRNTNRLPVLATFSDILPKQYMNNGIKHPNYVDTSKAMIYVLQRSKTTTVNQFAQDSACFQTNQHIHLRNACFVLLQLIHTLKSLQAEGIEEIDYDLGRILLLHTDVDKPPILVLLPGDKVYLTKTDFYKADVAMRKMTLCQTTLQLLFHLLQIKTSNELRTCVVNGEPLAMPVAYTFEVIAQILMEEKASSLSQAKGLLEYMLWGPVDIKTSGSDEDVDIILQRWLDLQRAQMVKSLVSNLHLKISSHTGFHVYEEYQLIFLLQATVKTLKDIISKL